ncbi:GtrA family protein [Qipengyuania atrilutea]|uniref:GtrA family protein n=1 Tax=Qipengyuania atrilutea TaxID=2744473 RepID=A0A850H3X4_9SPHN|nr:GtrA family protein [Actirhodobacter atriluteus]NVD44573.1 GtrA family protein [Actirhodobacter atriluteus]
MSEVIGKLGDWQAMRYLAASVAALAADFAAFLILVQAGMLDAAASAAGYTLGIVVHWLFSSRLVFADGVADRGSQRSRQKAFFVVSALVGLVLTIAIVGAADAIGFSPVVAKCLAIVVSFSVTYLIRAKLVFRNLIAPEAA